MQARAGEEGGETGGVGGSSGRDIQINARITSTTTSVEERVTSRRVNLRGWLRHCISRANCSSLQRRLGPPPVKPRIGPGRRHGHLLASGINRTIDNVCQHGGSSSHDVVFNGIKPCNVQSFLDRWPHPNAIAVSSSSAISDLVGHRVMEATQSLEHAICHHPGLTSIKQHGLTDHLVEEAHSAGGNPSFDQHPRQHPPSASGLH